MSRFEALTAGPNVVRLCATEAGCLDRLGALLVRCPERRFVFYVPDRKLAARIASEVGTSQTEAQVGCGTCDIYVGKGVTAFVTARVGSVERPVDGLAHHTGRFEPLPAGDGACVPVPPKQTDEPGLGVAPGTRRCLPAVAASCSCVYPCSSGVRSDDRGRYAVRIPGFGKPVDAEIAPWCVNGECTDAFFTDLVCSALCEPKLADRTCRFDVERGCVGAEK